MMDSESQFVQADNEEIELDEESGEVRVVDEGEVEIEGSESGVERDVDEGEVEIEIEESEREEEGEVEIEEGESEEKEIEIGEGEVEIEIGEEGESEEEGEVEIEIGEGESEEEMISRIIKQLGRKAPSLPEEKFIVEEYESEEEEELEIEEFAKEIEEALEKVEVEEEIAPILTEEEIMVKPEYEIDIPTITEEEAEKRIGERIEFVKGIPKKVGEERLAKIREMRKKFQPMIVTVPIGFRFLSDTKRRRKKRREKVLIEAGVNPEDAEKIAVALPKKVIEETVAPKEIKEAVKESDVDFVRDRRSIFKDSVIVMLGPLGVELSVWDREHDYSTTEIVRSIVPKKARVEVEEKPIIAPIVRYTLYNSIIQNAKNAHMIQFEAPSVEGLGLVERRIDEIIARNINRIDELSNNDIMEMYGEKNEEARRYLVAHRDDIISVLTTERTEGEGVVEMEEERGKETNGGDLVQANEEEVRVRWERFSREIET